MIAIDGYADQVNSMHSIYPTPLRSRDEIKINYKEFDGEPSMRMSPPVLTTFSLVVTLTFECLLISPKFAESAVTHPNQLDYHQLMFYADKVDFCSYLVWS